MHYKSNTIIFQMATNPLTKVALRLNSLLSTILQASIEVHPIIHNYALQSLLEVIQLIQKPELKSRFLKELMRIEHLVHKGNLKISPELYINLYTQIQKLNHVIGRFGEGIQSNPFLQSMQLSQTNSTKDCEDESLQLLLWLELDPKHRQKDLTQWLSALQTLKDTIDIYIGLIKQTAQFEKIALNNGFYQKSLPPKTNCHLILLLLDKTMQIIPQMQIGHHGLSIRLLEARTLKEVNSGNAELELALCQI